MAKRKPKKAPEVLAVAIRGVFDVLATAVERFGLSGTVVILTYIFIERYATIQQKREIINQLLHPGAKGPASFLVLLVAGVFVFLGQNHVRKKRVEAKDFEIRRLAEWKTDHQQAKITTKLHHSKSITKSPATHQARGRKTP